MNSKEKFSDSLLEKEDILNVKKFFHKLLRSWYWFLLGGIIGAGIGYYKTKTTNPTFEVKSLYFVKSDNGPNIGLDNIPFTRNFGNVNLQNHIGILTSQTINRRVLENLDWSVSWYRKLRFRNVEMYGNEPFDVVFDKNSENLKNVPLLVQMLDTVHYKVTVDSKSWINGRETEVRFSQKGIIGKIFSNDYFNFTLYPKNVRIGDQFHFLFNDFEDQVYKYMSRLDVEPAEDGSRADLISLSLTNTVPQKAADYLNELSRVYIEYELTEKNHKSATTIEFIDSQLKDVVDTLKVAGKNFTNFRAKNQIVDLSQEGGLMMNQLSKLDAEKTAAQNHLDYCQNLQKYLNNSEKMAQMVSPSVVGIVDESLNKMVARLSDLYRNREVISYTAKDKNPKLVMMDNEIEMLKRTLKENLSNLIENAKMQLNGVEKRMEKLNNQLTAYPKTEQQMINMKRMYDLNNDLYTFLLKKRAEAAITNASNVADTEVLDEARPELAIYLGPFLIKNVGIGLFGGLVVPFIVIVLASYYNDQIKSAEDIEEYSDIPVVGNIVKSNFGSEYLTAIDNPRSAIAESFREIRTNLQFINSDKNKKSLLIGINSVIPGEGKSFISANLASMIAINNKKVLLVDCDMRKPSLHNRLKYKNKEGLSNFLTGFSTFDSIVRQTRVENLNFISAGPIPPNPSELLENGKFEELIDNASATFDYIVFDNPPVSLVIDGIVIGQMVDINLFVTRQDFSKRSEVKFIDHVNKNKGMKNAGIILNDIHLSKHAHVGAYGAEYGYKKKNSYYYFDSSPSFKPTK